MLALFFGTDHKTRSYRRFSDAAQDVVGVRIYQGIHFQFADTAALKQRRDVAKWAFKHFQRPKPLPEGSQ